MCRRGRQILIFQTRYFHFSLNHFLESKTPENWVGKIGALSAYLFISQWVGVAFILFRPDPVYFRDEISF